MRWDSVGRINLLGQGVPTIGDVARDRVGISGIDLANFLQRRLIIEIQVLKTDQERVASPLAIAPRTASRRRRIKARVFW